MTPDDYTQELAKRRGLMRIPEATPPKCYECGNKNTAFIGQAGISVHGHSHPLFAGYWRCGSCGNSLIQGPIPLEYLGKNLPHGATDELIERAIRSSFRHESLLPNG